MVKFFLLSLTLVWSATKVNTLAYRAAEQYKQGNFHYSWNLYERAHEESKKEANETLQRRILLNMGHMAVQSMQYDLADSLLALYPVDLSDKAAERIKSVYVFKAWMQGKCPSTFSLPTTEDWVEIPSLKSWVYHQALCASSQDEDFFHKATAFWEKESGQKAFLLGEYYLAKQSWEEAISSFHTAFDKAQAGKKHYQVGWILFQIAKGYQALGKTDLSLRFFRRSADVYQRIGLTKPYIMALQEQLKIKPDEALRERLLKLQKLP